MADDDDLGIEESIGAALDEQLGAEAPVKEQPEQKSTKDDAFPKSEDMPARREYVRDGRRFVAKEEPEGEAKPAAAKGGEQPKEQAPPAQTEKAPLWFKNEYGEWEKLHPDFRKALQQREKDFAQGIEKHATTAKAWDPINEAVKPYEAQLRAQGQTPQQFIGGLVNIYGYLQQDPVQALNWLAQSTLGQGWGIRELADWMDQQGVQGTKIDPVKQELDALKQKLAHLEALPAQQQLDATRATISEWSKDKPYYAELEPTIMGLIQADPSVRERFRVDARATLDTLYDRAQWTHPEIRSRILEDQRKAEVKRARDNTLGTRGAPPANGVARSTPKMSLEDEIGMLLDGGTV